MTAIRMALFAGLLSASCTTGATLNRQVEAMQSRLDRAWADGGYRCAPRPLAQAEAQLVFVRTELEQGDPVRAERHRQTAEAFLGALTEKMKTCPSLIPDSDGDGLLDNVDNCPNEPEDIDGHEDEDGCPEQEDRDSDGVFDPDDDCPAVPGPAANKGCPYGDTDGDGMTDDQDACPQAAEDVDGFEDEDGCPDPDNDQDGVPDAADRCPLEPETVNGFEDEDGCPDIETDLIRVNRRLGKIELTKKVFFATGRSRIQTRSYPLLDEVAKVLLANPNMRLVVEGHTDAVGPTTRNLRLSQRRADAVRAYLVDKDVAPARLTAIGFGEEKPIDSNRTRRGRERNRRVEFTITNE